MNKLVKCFLGLILLSSVFGCNSSVEPVDTKAPQKLTAKVGDKIVALDKYEILIGDVSKEKVEEGLVFALDGLQEAYDAELEKNPDLNMEGYLTYTFQVEPDGSVRMVFETGIELKDESQKDLRSNFTSHLMKKKIKFPKLKEMAMVEAKFKYE